TTSAWYSLRDYYAYDDGVAEYSVGLTQAGNRLAYRFEMISDTATLAGFEIYFPYLGGSNSQSLDLYIYGDEEGKPGFNSSYSLPSTPTHKYTEIELLYVPLHPPVFINNSVFYIGYREPVSSGIKIGLDKGNDTGDKIFVYTGSTWQQNNDVQGSLMIRPVFGGVADPITGVPDKERIREIYPNPNSGIFYIAGDVAQLEITDVTGRPVPWTLESRLISGGTDEQKVTLLSPVPGLYIVKWV